VLVKDGTVKIQPVKPGYLTMTDAEILDGLTTDDLVLTENLEQFRNGQSVRVTSIAEAPDVKKP